MKNIGKSFGNVKALDNVSFNVHLGEIHALCGENGAGKSTLMKILSGVYSCHEYEGEIFVQDNLARFSNPKSSEQAGIGIIYQELALIPNMSICENILLGQEPKKFGFIDWDLAYIRTEKVLKEVGLELNPHTLISQLGVGQKQLVEIAKALVKNVDILILDEPTAALSDIEANHLLSLLDALRTNGKTCIYISHRLNEIFKISDHVTILRDGQTIGTYLTASLTENMLISKMVGRSLSDLFPKQSRHPAEKFFEVKNWTVLDSKSDHLLVDDVSFSLRRGEVLGVAGLRGAGRTELVMSLFGALKPVVKGEVRLDKKKLCINKESDAIKSGLALVSEDRKRYGLILDMKVKHNMTLSSLNEFSVLGFIDQAKEIHENHHFVKELHIKTTSIEQPVKNLSGGNQQKVVLSKWLMTKPRVLILDEPTCGIDVAAKFEIYLIIEKLLAEGIGIIMISSELSEVIGLSDRIIVMANGRLTGEFDRKSVTQEKLMQCAMQHSKGLEI